MQARIRLVLSILTALSPATGCKNGDGGFDAGDASETQATTTAQPGTTDASTTATQETDPTGVDSTGDTGPVACPYPPVDGQPGVQLELVAGGFDRPVLVVGHPTEPETLFVVEQGGTVRVLEAGMNQAPSETFLQIEVSNAVNNTIGNERGLLGFALHPNFPDDPKVYVAYNPDEGSSPPTVVEEITVGANGRADLSTRRVIIAANQPAGNHNGGMIAFGPDGYLYFGTGDGGGSGDPYNTGRDPAFILGKLLRIGVEPDGQANEVVACGGACGSPNQHDYTIPADNPFVDDPSFAPEIWAWGFRNPWRFSFDQRTGDLYVADVGQNAWEEVSLAVAGADYGWSAMEGFHCFGGAQCDEQAGPNQVNAQGMTMPLAEYSISGSRCCVVGLGVYRSCEVPAWEGMYFYGDYCTGEVFALVWDGQNATELGTVWSTNAGDRILGGGNNAHGDVFVTTVIVPFQGAPIEDGRVYRIAPAG